MLCVGCVVLLAKLLAGPAPGLQLPSNWIRNKIREAENPAQISSYTAAQFSNVTNLLLEVYSNSIPASCPMYRTYKHNVRGYRHAEQTCKESAVWRFCESGE